MKNTLIVHIDKMVNEGVGLATLGTGIKVFVPYAVKDDVLEIIIKEKKKDYWIGEIKKIINPSPMRGKPLCRYFGSCGGCQWQMVDYRYQPVLKREMVLDSFAHIAGIREIAVLDTIPSPRSYYYRNKVHFPVKRVSPKEVIMGFYKRNTHYIIDVDSCPLHLRQYHQIFRKAKIYLGERGLSIYDERTQKGVIRNFTIRGSEKTGESLIVVVTREKYLTRGTAQELMKLDSTVIGVVENINPQRGNAIFGDTSILRGGQDYFHEKIKNYTFVVSATSFFQVNTDVAEKMVEALENILTQIGEVNTILDAYSGVGLFSIPAAKYSKKVIALEILPSATRDAAKNIKINAKTNIELVEGDANEVIESIERADVVILDPPRKGISENVVKYLANYKPENVLYFSCNPATMARDIKLILQSGYDIEYVRPFDMFPQTFHVETLTYLKRKN